MAPRRGAGDEGSSIYNYFSCSFSFSFSLEMGLLVAVLWAENMDSLSSCCFYVLSNTAMLAADLFFYRKDVRSGFYGSFCELKNCSKVVGYFFVAYLCRPKSPPGLVLLRLSEVELISSSDPRRLIAGLLRAGQFFLVSLGANEGTYALSSSISSSPKLPKLFTIEIHLNTNNLQRITNCFMLLSINHELTATNLLLINEISCLEQLTSIAQQQQIQITCLYVIIFSIQTKQHSNRKHSMAQKSGFNLMALQKNIQQSLAKPNAKQACFMFEYKLLLLYSANFGIYVMPQTNAIDIWHGVVFVRFGLYKDAKLKFKMMFENFPKRPPKVYFMSEVYHPNVNPETGLVDLGNDLEKDWNYGTEHLIFTVVQYIRLLFLDVRFYENAQSYNKSAGELFVSSPDEFFIKVRECVQNSKAHLFQNYTDTSFKFTPFTTKHEKIKDNLKEICEDQSLSMEEKKKKFMKSLKQNS